MNVTATPNTRLLRTPLPRSYHQSTPFCIWPQKAPPSTPIMTTPTRSEEHTSELQSQSNLVCRLLLEKKKNIRVKDTDGFNGTTDLLYDEAKGLPLLNH